MEEELKSLIKVWSYAIISVTYCYYITTRIKAGLLRLLSVIPVCVLFLYFPLFFSSIHFFVAAAFFFSWLANFKLILFSFDQGPLYPLPQNLSRFIFFTCLPIKLQQNPSSHNQIPKWVFAIKIGIFGLLLQILEYKQYLSPSVVLILYSFHIYFELEILFMLVNVLVFFTFGCDLEPQSNEPYLSTSLQDFWGRRWNLMVPTILRPAVYNPVRTIAERKMNSDWARFLAGLATFVVSGLLHELLFFYVTREMPTGEVTLFFVLHGVCMGVEVAVKKSVRWRMSPMVSRLITVVFIFMTSGWLFIPTLIRSGMLERFANEAFLFIAYVKNKFSIGD